MASVSSFSSEWCLEEASSKTCFVADESQSQTYRDSNQSWKQRASEGPSSKKITMAFKYFLPWRLLFVSGKTIIMEKKIHLNDKTLMVLHVNTDGGRVHETWQNYQHNLSVEFLTNKNVGDHAGWLITEIQTCLLK